MLRQILSLEVMSANSVGEVLLGVLRLWRTEPVTNPLTVSQKSQRMTTRPSCRALQPLVQLFVLYGMSHASVQFAIFEKFSWWTLLIRQSSLKNHFTQNRRNLLKVRKHSIQILTSENLKSNLAEVLIVESFANYFRMPKHLYGMEEGFFWVLFVFSLHTLSFRL